MNTSLLAISQGFTKPDWLVVIIYLFATTLIGAKLAGKQATIRDFFLGGRKLPWWAICGSIVATEVSAATIVGVPTISYLPGGNLTYLQLALGSILARVIVAKYLVRKYYEHEIYSPYDYVGARLGGRVKNVTTGLFFLGAVLGQGARLYIAASVLGVVAGLKLVPAIWLMGALGVGWTLLGGMTTVIWTDVIQFSVVIIGAIIALIASVISVPGGAAEVIRLGSEAGKFQLFDFTPDLSRSYTFWAAIFALPFLNLAAFGTDQVLAQRMFCCRNESEARKAILWSNVSLFIPVLMLGVGIALHAYFIHQPLSSEESTRILSDRNSLFPIFIVRALPVGVRGVIVAAIFAAAVSTLLGALTALSQATVSFFVKPSDLTDDGKHGASRAVIWSKMLVIAWGMVLCLMATGCIELAKGYKNVIDLALALARYTYGPLLGVFLLAFLPKRRDDKGLIWAVGLTILCVIGISGHEVSRLAAALRLPERIELQNWIVWIGASAFLFSGLFTLTSQPKKIATLIAAIAIIIALHHANPGTIVPGRFRLDPFWHYPIATLMTLSVAYLLGNPRAIENAR